MGVAGDPGQPQSAPPSPGRAAVRVASGILSSRVLGLVRDQLVAFLFGVGAHADVYRVAFRGPNILQNLLGEQTLSASFIPVYSRLLAAGREREAGRLAGAVLALLLAVTAALTLAGIFLAPQLVALFAPGFLADATGGEELDRYRLTVRAVRVIFPMVGVLVLSSWSLGVLNSHRRFFLPYFAPVLWNTAVIAALVAAAEMLVPGGLLAAGGGVASGVRSRILLAACWGALAGAGLQFGLQLPAVASSLTGFRLAFSPRLPGVAEVLRNLAPLVASRGVVQLSAYLDQVLGSLLAAGAVAALGLAHSLYILPISLFALSVAAVELPELSRQAGGGAAALGARARRSLRRIAFLMVPTVVGYLALGFVLVGALFRRGQFGLADNWLVYWVLAAYAIGLLASGWSRLLANVFYALGDTRAPARIAVARVAVSAAVGAASMLYLDRFEVADLVALPEPGRALRLGAVGLALGAAVGSWFELWRLRRALGAVGPALPLAAAAALAGRALLALVVAAAAIHLLAGARIELQGAAAMLGYAGAYLVLCRFTGVSEAEAFFARFARRRSR